MRVASRQVLKSVALAGMLALSLAGGALAQAAGPGDTLAILSNGGFGGIHGKLLLRLDSVA
jgi:hypothetical protein